MVRSSSFALALIGWTLHAAGVVVDVALPGDKRTPDVETDTYEIFGRVTGRPDLKEDHVGGVQYDKPFSYITQGSTIGENPYSGIKPKSGDNVALLTLGPDASGTFRSSKMCAKLQKLYYGCTTTNVQSTANVPLRCSMTVTALRPGVNGQQDSNINQTFSYVPKYQTYNSVPKDPKNALFYAEMAEAVIDLPVASKYHLSASLEPEPKANLELIPSLLRPILELLIKPAKETATALLIDNPQYVQFSNEGLCKVD